MAIDFSEKRVLIVDDHAGMRSSMRAILSSFGVVYSEMAGTANDAIRRLQTKSYDIIVCDYFLGDGTDGQQLLEQLRHNKLIKLQTIFVMVTAESAYERVVSAVELAPDDYLIKPFTADTLSTRLERVMQKKQAFAPIHELIDKNQIANAIVVCSQAVAQGGKYTIDLLRLLAELYVTQGKFEDAETIYQRVMEMRAIPWARMGLAKMLHFQGKDEEAEALLEVVVQEAPEYMAAYDLLAKVYEANDKAQQAQATLSKALAASPYTMHRQKQMGEVALRNNDLEAAEAAFANVVERGKTSFFREPDDYANLSKVQMERGKLDIALGTMRDMRKSFNDTPEVNFTAAVMESLVHKKAGNDAASGEALETALRLKQGNDLKLTDDLALNLATSCLQHGKDDEAKGIVEGLVSNNHESAALIQKAKQVFAEAGREAEGNALVDGSVKSVIALNNEGVRKAQQGDLEGSVRLLTEAAERLPGNIQIVLNAAQALLVYIDQRGWNETFMESAQHYLSLVRAREPDHPKLLVVNKLAQEISRKFGIAA
jgi:DNA-binding response OmpR family regulator/Tfp pilus assembly protein PilF